jgi:hypothetical protein
MHASTEVDHLVTSPSGKYLAVKESPEGAEGIDIVDLPELMRHGTYRSIDAISSFPLSVSIEEWNERELHVKSEMLLSSPGDRHLELAGGEELFTWNVETGVVVPQSASLQDPAQYYCGKISSQRGKDGAGVAIAALRFLKRQSGVSCLEQALATESDEGVRADIRAALQEIAQAAALQRECLSGTPGAVNANGTVVERVTTLFVRGRSTPMDTLLCIAGLNGGERFRSIWFRFDRTKPDAGGEFLLEGDRDRVERLRASPDGKYLAVQTDFVDVVDLPLLLTAGRYKSVRAILGSFKDWNGAALEVTSDTLLSHAQVEVGDESHPLPLLAKESFVWNSETDVITPAWNALQYPNRYYCEGLSSPEAEKRRIASKGLRLLGDRDTVSCIERALRSESDEGLQRELRETLVNLAK